MNSGSDFVELRSEDVQELLTRVPSWLLRWGIAVVLAVLSLLLLGAWFIHYPDLVRASFKLTSANAPRAVVTRTDGKIVRLLVRENQSVRAGDVLAYLESTAYHDDVLRLSAELGSAWQLAGLGGSHPGRLEALAKLHLSGYHRLGELQVAYQTFEQAHIQLAAYLANGFYGKKKAMLRQEIADLQDMALNLHDQHTIQAQDIKLAGDEYAVQQLLARDKVIAPLDLTREESKYNARKLPYQQTVSALIANRTAQRTKAKEILETDRQIVEERDKFLQALNTLQSAVEGWKKTYVLTAPVAGRVVFPTALRENQTVRLNQELVYVAPLDTDYFGELYIPQQNAGKVQVGQRVLVKFAGFPYQEFGAVRGEIATIADMPLQDSVFRATVTLPIGLTTTYGKLLAYKTGMTASADIVTADSRLLEKLFYQLRKVMNGL